MMFCVIDTFSGIGGFSLGLEQYPEFRTVAFAENDYFCGEVLRKHWPDVPIFRDVRDVTRERLENEGIIGHGRRLILTAGWPCQGFSVAGGQAGLDDARSGLWTEIVRMVGEIRPDYIILENSPALLTGGDGGWLAAILADLAALGLDAEWHCIPASAINDCPHQRDRIWIIAYPAGQRQPPEGAPWESRDQETDGERETVDALHACLPERWFPVPDVLRVDAWSPTTMDRLRALGNAVVPAVVTILAEAILEREHSLFSNKECKGIM